MIRTHDVKNVALSLGWGYTNHQPTRCWMEHNHLQTYPAYCHYMQSRGYPDKDLIADEVTELWMSL